LALVMTGKLKSPTLALRIPFLAFRMPS
jgi:hypothetical protein